MPGGSDTKTLQHELHQLSRPGLVHPIMQVAQGAITHAISYAIAGQHFVTLPGYLLQLVPESFLFFYRTVRYLY
jgi:hypothetical protein